MIEVLRPDGLVYAGGWVWAGTLPGAINDQNNATFIGNTDVDDEFEVTFPNLPPQAYRIASFMAYYTHSKEPASPGQIRQYVRLGGNTTYASYRTPPDDPTVTESSDALARPGGATYEPADINSQTGGCGSTGGIVSATLRVHEMRWVVDWAHAPGGFFYTLLPWLGPLAGVGLHEMPGLARALHLASGGRLTLRRDELEEACRDLGRRRPAYAF